MQLEGQRTLRRFFTPVSTPSTQGNWGLLITASGGTFGKQGEVFDTGTGKRTPLNHADAVLRQARVVLYMPPHGDAGLLIAETRSGSHLTQNVINMLNTNLKSNGLVLRTDHDMVDSAAWELYLGSNDLNLKRVEMVTHSKLDDVSQVTQDGVRKTAVKINIEPDSPAARGITQRVLQVFAGWRSGNRQPLRMADLVGLASYDQDRFTEQKLVVTVGGKDRTISLRNGFPIFSYDFIDADARPSNHDFLTEVNTVAASMFEILEVDTTPGWMEVHP